MSATLSDGVLTVTGTLRGDEIEVERDDGRIKVDVNDRERSFRSASVKPSGGLAGADDLSRRDG